MIDTCYTIVNGDNTVNDRKRNVSNITPQHTLDEITRLEKQLAKKEEELQRFHRQEERLRELVEKLERMSERHFDIDAFADNIPDGYGDAAVWLLRELEIGNQNGS